MVKQSNERLQDENRELIKRNERLLAQTNLQPLHDAFNAWQSEARGNFQNAMRRLEEIRSENIHGIEAAQAVLVEIAETLKQGRG